MLNGRWLWFIFFSDIDNYETVPFIRLIVFLMMNGRLIGELLRFCIQIFSSTNRFHSFAMVNDIHCQWTSSIFFFFLFLFIFSVYLLVSSHSIPFCTHFSHFIIIIFLFLHGYKYNIATGICFHCCFQMEHAC